MVGAVICPCNSGQRRAFAGELRPRVQCKTTSANVQNVFLAGISARFHARRRGSFLVLFDLLKRQLGGGWGEGTCLAMRASNVSLCYVARSLYPAWPMVVVVMLMLSLIYEDRSRRLRAEESYCRQDFFWVSVYSPTATLTIIKRRSNHRQQQ